MLMQQYPPEVVEIVDSPPSSATDNTSTNGNDSVSGSVAGELGDGRPKRIRAAACYSEELILMQQLGDLLPPAPAPVKKMRPDKPRWHTQTYMLVQALKSHSKGEMPRTELIRKAIELDKKISREKKLPLVFRGKTPMNSASACLTNNADRVFVASKPQQAKTTYFRLAWVPCDLESSIAEYKLWMDVLIKHDWPICFAGMPVEIISEKVEFGPTRELDILAAAAAFVNHSSETSRKLPPPMSAEERAERARQFRNLEHSYNKKLNIRPAACDRNTSTAFTGSGDNPYSTRTNTKKKKIGDNPYATRRYSERKKTESVSPPPNEEPIKVETPCSMASAETMDIPQDWRDVVKVGQSSIPNAGKGLFAGRRLPAWCPIGFYFGVPMLEDEFDAGKEAVGVASRYAIMYRRTVLDATDGEGQPWEDESGLIYCPFHFMNEDAARGNIAFVEGAQVNQVICMTTREIQCGEELFAYYGTEIDREHYKGDE